MAGMLSGYLGANWTKSPRPALSRRARPAYSLCNLCFRLDRSFVAFAYEAGGLLFTYLPIE
jgi:hypothetical protein